jgi:hypothetical protein
MADLEKDQGDVITYGQIRELSGAGVSGDSAMEAMRKRPIPTMTPSPSARSETPSGPAVH